MKKTHTTNYIDTFIEVAADCGCITAAVPLWSEGKKSIARLQYEMLFANPYRYTSDDVLFQVFAERKGLIEGELDSAREEYFSKGQACFRASPLPKKYGWGVHHDKDGKIAIFGIETSQYQKLLADDNIKKLKAMRSTRGTPT